MKVGKRFTRQRMQHIEEAMQQIDDELNGLTEEDDDQEQEESEGYKAYLERRKNSYSYKREHGLLVEE